MTSTSTTTEKKAQDNDLAKKVLLVLVMVFIRALVVWWLLPIVNDDWGLTYVQGLALIIATDALIWLPARARAKG